MSTQSEFGPLRSTTSKITAIEEILKFAPRHAMGCFTVELVADFDYNAIGMADVPMRDRDIDHGGDVHCSDCGAFSVEYEGGPIGYVYVVLDPMGDIDKCYYVRSYEGPTGL